MRGPTGRCSCSRIVARPTSAPENTLASFRRAGEEHADFVELDVQESSDGVVVVAHDRDLMKVARSPLQIWSSTAQQLREVDIGSSFSAAFKDERVPTLAEALAVCKGVCRINIELKDYGKSQRLEERVVELVEAAGMQNDIVTMSLNRTMVENMKRLRPNWTAGLLAAKAIGQPSRLPFDFLAVESRMATHSIHPCCARGTQTGLCLDGERSATHDSYDRLGSGWADHRSARRWRERY